MDDDDIDYDKVTRLSEKIQQCISDITEAVHYNIQDETPESILSAYSALITVTSYFEFKLRNDGISGKAIEITKDSAEKYVLTLISQELKATPQKKGDA
jgi:hypothetical protein